MPAVGQTSLFDAIGKIYAARGTGVLVVRRPEGMRRLYFRNGELHLAPSHPLAVSIGELLAETPPHTELNGTALDEIVERMAHALSGWNGSASRFVELAEEIPADAVGPLPTDILLIHGSVEGQEPNDLLDLLGGEDAVWQAAEEKPIRESDAELNPKQAYLLSRLDRPTAIHDLLSNPGLDRSDVIRRLRQLQVLGLIRRAVEKEPDRVEDLLPDGLLERFLDRVERSLDERPLDLGLEGHRTELGALLEKTPDSYYDLLRVDPRSSSEEIYRSYSRLARRAHPMHAAELEMGDREAELKSLFRRLTEAYLILSDPDRRSAYTASIMPRAGVAGPAKPEDGGESSQRQSERREVAKQQFQQATSHAEMLDYHYAIQLLSQAVAADPRPEYYALLGECQAQNPRWLDRAAESYGKALELDPLNVENWVARAHVMEKIGRFEEARRSYGRALELQPGHVGAQLGFDSLRQQLKPRSSGLLGTLRRFLGG